MEYLNELSSDRCNKCATPFSEMYIMTCPFRKDSNQVECPTSLNQSLLSHLGFFALWVTTPAVYAQISMRIRRLICTNTAHIGNIGFFLSWELRIKQVDLDTNR